VRQRQFRKTPARLKISGRRGLTTSREMLKFSLKPQEARKEEMIMTLIRWDPFREVSALQERMNRLFSNYRSASPYREEEISQSPWVPPVDIYETEDSLVFKAELPGVTKEDITVEVKDNTLTLKGEKKFGKEAKEESYHRVERAYGAFQRAFTLPGTMEQDKVKAKFKDGILEIVLPKAEKSKPKQIRVEVG
jgi:HSP20 family protein